VATDTALALHELSFVPEAGEVVVGRLDTGTYAVLPADGAQLLRRLCEGMTPAAAGRWYETEFGEPVDVDDFVDGLRELGFVRDGTAVAARPVRFRRVGELLFSPGSFALQIAVIGVWLWLLSGHADLRPRPGQIFFTGSLLAVQLTIMVVQIPLLFMHEGYHILAGQRLGLPSTLRISNRLTYVVFETQLNGALSVTRRKRYLPFLAGMFADCVQLAALGIAAHLTRHADGSFSLFGAACLAMAFTVVMRLAWQFQLYLRTDLYYVLATALNCYDLHDASKALLKNRIWRALRRPERQVDVSAWTERDRRVGSWYGIFLALGITTLVTITLYGSIPVIVQYFGTAFRHIGSGTYDAAFFDALLSLAANAVQIGAVVYLSRRKRRRPSPAPATSAGRLT
jgi:hypothetical protein